MSTLTPMSKQSLKSRISRECNVPIISATQTTRAGYGSTDVDLTDTSESFGLPATADLMLALISTEDEGESDHGQAVEE